MKFTKKAEYSVILASELALEGTGLVSLSQLAKKCQVSYGLLRNVAFLLSKAGLVAGEEGKSGGYRLAKPADRIVLREVLEAIGEPIIHCPCCGGEKECAGSSVCPRNSILISLQGAIDGIIGDLTLGKLVKGDASCMKMWKRY
ncbi:MAG: Rrf2 family transcriptional regulator [bacterium]|nr:Rrf2 family transcriptional regulator [bacterium]